MELVIDLEVQYGWSSGGDRQMTTRFGPAGTEFVATMGTKPHMAIGFVHMCSGEDVGLEVIGYDGKTFSGAQWYRFRVVAI